MGNLFTCSRPGRKFQSTERYVRFAGTVSISSFVFGCSVKRSGSLHAIHEVNLSAFRLECRGLQTPSRLSPLIHPNSRKQRVAWALALSAFFVKVRTRLTRN